MGPNRKNQQTREINKNSRLSSATGESRNLSFCWSDLPVGPGNPALLAFLCFPSLGRCSQKFAWKLFLQTNGDILSDGCFDRIVILEQSTCFLYMVKRNAWTTIRFKSSTIIMGCKKVNPLLIGDLHVYSGSHEPSSTSHLHFRSVDTLAN